MYRVQVANCTNHVQEAPAQQLSIRSQETEEVVFEINMKVKLAYQFTLKLCEGTKTQV